MIPRITTVLTSAWRRLRTLRDAKRERAITRTLAATGLFDAAFYLSENGDVRRSGMDPLLHFVRHGAAEGRRPSAAFDLEAFAARNATAATGALRPLLELLRTRATALAPAATSAPISPSLARWRAEVQGHSHRCLLVGPAGAEARGHLATFLALGTCVTVVPPALPSLAQTAEALQDSGAWWLSGVAAPGLLRDHGDLFDAVVLVGADSARAVIEPARHHCPRAALLLLTGGDELDLMRRCDVTLVPSALQHDRLAGLSPETLVVVVPAAAEGGRGDEAQVARRQLASALRAAGAPAPEPVPQA